ncbi:MAG: CPBP family intramembrane metalloprotease [Flavobacteriia bacterium]|nr:CPBP family intramembrane metalloprotease [Flavobacteriia bacterium]OJX36068.1 MAG: hypothetical protein BGO87_06275 [Flavobacteriia bacterium 40-80]
MTSKNTLRVILFTVLGFVLHYLLFLNFNSFKTAFDNLTHQGLTSYIITYFLIGIPIFAATNLIDTKKSTSESLGLSGSIKTGVLFAVIVTLPMFAGGCLFFDFNSNIDIENLIAGTFVAGFMEELYYRGFLFGQLFKNTKLGFFSSVFLGALIFASGHLYQSYDVTELIGIFTVTFFGAVFFAWLFTEWKYNLWTAVFTHSFMNLSWNLFEVDNTALGDVKANVFRGLTIVTAILFTVIYKRRNKEALIINKSTLFRK